jgi:hypothetical protein
MNFGMKRHPVLSRAFKGLAVAIASFVGFGTVAALWENPLFLLSILLGVYVGIRRPFCAAKTATASGIVGFIGIACPVCNKILLLLFGGELLLTYFEPVRIYVAGAGVLLAAVAVAYEWSLIKRRSAEVAA